VPDSSEEPGLEIGLFKNEKRYHNQDFNFNNPVLKWFYYLNRKLTGKTLPRRCKNKNC
jgi:hypothetical protein